MTEFTAYDELMPKIQALIAPGDSSSSKDKVSTEHHFFKRKGKWHNHDSCDACGEKGKLLCCDICPASFHLLCHDPPLDVAHVPNGPWTCYACNNIRDRKNNPARKSYKIEFVNGNTTSTGIRERRSHNSTRNAHKKDLLPTKSMLFLSLCKSNSSSLANANPSKSVSKATNFNSFSAATVRDKSSDFKENVSKLNPKLRPSQVEVRSNNGDASPISLIDGQDADSNSDVEIKSEWIEETEYGFEDSNSSSKNVPKKNAMSVDETVEKSVDGVGAEDPNRSNSNISIMNCDFVLDNKSVSGDKTEARISSLDKGCLLKDKNTSEVDERNSISGIEKVFNVIVHETKKLNPRQFALPREYVVDLDENLLRPEKDLDSFSCDWDSNDLLKIPSRRCYFCNGICLSGQLISCDYCPAHFHLNCLDPPMCSLPDIKWMCPLHPHHILEKVMDDPDSITQLTAWWRDLAQSVDSKEVISRFIKKINRQKKSAPPPVESSVKIPDIVKYHYKNPVPQIPERSDSTSRKSGCVFEEAFTLVPHDLFMVSNDCCRQRSQNEQFRNQIITNEIAEKARFAFANTASINEPMYDPHSLIEITSDEKLDSRDSQLNENHMKKDENLSTWDPTNKSFRFKSYGIYDLDVPAGTLRKIIPQYGKPPWEKIEEILDRHIEDDFIIGGSKYTALDRDLKRLLINEELQFIVQDLPPSFLPNCTPYPFTPPEASKTLVPNKKSVHAVLCPLSHRAPLIFMNDGTLSIGTDFSNDVCLSNYGHCNFISREHAVIFYDKPSRTYELLNYSEYCTVIDGIAYTCDISSPTESSESCSEKLAVDKVDSIVDEKIGTKESNDGAVEKVESGEKPKLADPTSVARTKPSGLESRNLFKKLMTDIDKLILKSKKEMASVAEEDLNEIARAMKTSADTNRVIKESVADKQKVKKKPDFTIHLKRFDSEIIDLCDDDPQPKTVSKENPTPAISKPSPENVTQHINDSCEPVSNQNTSLPDTVAPSFVLPVIKEVTSIAATNQAEATTLRRSERKIKRSIFATYRRELRKDKKLGLDMLGSDSEDESKVAKKKAPPPVTTVEEGPTNNSNRPPNNGRYVADTKEKCRCQMNNSDLPDGMDSSWETSAALHHGSHIRFGCVEFVFSIVNRTTDLKIRSYQQLRTSSSQTTSSCARKPKGIGVRPAEGVPPPPKKAKKAEDEDLSSKLRSLLNVLSSTKSSSSRSSSSAANLSPRSSPELSRSPSPRPSSDPASLIEVNYEESDHIRHEIRTEDS